MILYEELYFEITVKGSKTELRKLASYLTSGDLDDFFEFTDEYIHFDDDYFTYDDKDRTYTMILSNDDCGIEIDEFDTDEFLEEFCKVARNLDVDGRLADIDDDEYEFTSAEGDSYYLNAKKSKRYYEEYDEDEDETDVDDNFAELMAELSSIVQSIFGDNASVHIVLE